MNKKKFIHIESNGVSTVESLPESKHRRIKVYANDPKLSHLIAGMGLNINGADVSKSVENYLIESEKGEIVLASLPSFIISGDRYVSLMNVNPSLCKAIILDRVSKAFNDEVTGKQNALINSVMPGLKDGFSISALLPLLTNRSALSYAVRMELYDVIVTNVTDEEVKKYTDNGVIDYIQELVQADDESGIEIPLLNQKLLTHPQVAPVLTKLFNNEETKKAAEALKNKNDQPPRGIAQESYVTDYINVK